MQSSDTLGTMDKIRRMPHFGSVPDCVVFGPVDAIEGCPIFYDLTLWTVAASSSFSSSAAEAEAADHRQICGNEQQPMVLRREIKCPKHASFTSVSQSRTAKYDQHKMRACVLDALVTFQTFRSVVSNFAALRWPPDPRIRLFGDPECRDAERSSIQGVAAGIAYLSSRPWRILDGPSGGDAARLQFAFPASGSQMPSGDFHSLVFDAAYVAQPRSSVLGLVKSDYSMPQLSLMTKTLRTGMPLAPSKFVPEKVVIDIFCEFWRRVFPGRLDAVVESSRHKPRRLYSYRPAYCLHGETGRKIRRQMALLLAFFGDLFDLKLHAEMWLVALETSPAYRASKGNPTAALVQPEQKAVLEGLARISLLWSQYFSSSCQQFARLRSDLRLLWRAERSLPYFCHLSARHEHSLLKDRLLPAAKKELLGKVEAFAASLQGGLPAMKEEGRPRLVAALQPLQERYPSRRSIFPDMAADAPALDAGQ